MPAHVHITRSRGRYRAWGGDQPMRRQSVSSVPMVPSAPCSARNDIARIRARRSCGKRPDLDHSSFACCSLYKRERIDTLVSSPPGGPASHRTGASQFQSYVPGTPRHLTLVVVTRNIRAMSCARSATPERTFCRHNYGRKILFPATVRHAQ